MSRASTRVIRRAWLVRLDARILAELERRGVVLTACEEDWSAKAQDYRCEAHREVEHG